MDESRFSPLVEFDIRSDDTTAPLANFFHRRMRRRRAGERRHSSELPARTVGENPGLPRPQPRTAPERRTFRLDELVRTGYGTLSRSELETWLLSFGLAENDSGDRMRLTERGAETAARVRDLQAWIRS